MGSHLLVAALKAELKRAGITYAQLARELGLAESSVKRLFSKGDLSLARIDQVLAVLKLDFAELARTVAATAPARRELTLAQEQAVVADQKLLLVTICALGEWSLEQIVTTYRLTRTEAAAALETLHRLDLIELRAQHRYRLKVDKTFRWRPHGPVMRYFREHAMAEYFDGGFDGPGETLLFVHGQVGTPQAVLLTERLQRLAQDFAQQHRADQRLPEADKRAYTLVMSMRSWRFGVFGPLLREPPLE